MAITGNYNYNGVAVGGAIAEVSLIQLREPTNPSECAFAVAIFANASQYDAREPFERKGYAFAHDLTRGDIWNQCYDYLLTLPDYAGWTTIP